MELLSVKNLRLSFATARGTAEILKGVSFDMGCEKLGVVGESGSGKSLAARALLDLVPAPGVYMADEMRFMGRDLLGMSGKERRAVRGHEMGLILQDPKFSLNPIMRVGEQLMEALRDRDAVLKMLERVCIDDPLRVFKSYPFELSGGMRQRAMIATTLLLKPKLLIADEPTSSLDATKRGGILKTLDALVQEEKMGLLFISHDLRLVANFCDRVIVMRAGEVVDICPARELVKSQHPYTQSLMKSLPSLEKEVA